MFGLTSAKGISAVANSLLIALKHSNANPLPPTS